MTYYTVCPICGYKLLKAGNGSNIEIFCPKCGEKMTIEIKDGKITILRILHNSRYFSKTQIGLSNARPLTADICLECCNPL